MIRAFTRAELDMLLGWSIAARTSNGIQNRWIGAADVLERKVTAMRDDMVQGELLAIRRRQRTAVSSVEETPNAE